MQQRASLQSRSIPRTTPRCFVSISREFEAEDWSTGPDLNRRILVLQTSALAPSPPVLTLPAAAESAAGNPSKKLLRLRGRAQVRLHSLEAGEFHGGFFVRNRAANDDVIALLPVRGRRHRVLGRQLNRVQHAN